ncbi:hypothetical protein [Sphingomonas sp. DT-204]
MISKHDIERIMRETGMDRLQAYRAAKAQHALQSLSGPATANRLK